MFNNQPVDSLTHAAVIFLVFLSIVLIASFTLYPIVTSLFDAFESADFAKAEDEKDTYLPIIEVAFTATLAIFISLPATWFIFWVFSREPGYERIRRY